jgi:hypothetical protein
MEDCKHTPNPCDETCACWCDKCQESYEAAWDRRVNEESLCPACGVPLGSYTMEQLLKHQYEHFFMPCQTCEPALKGFMEKAGLCYVCRSSLESDGSCVKCKTATVHTSRTPAEGAAQAPAQE